MTYGRHVHGETGITIDVLVDFDHADWKVGGVTIDWAKVTAAVSDTELAGGYTQKAGTKALRHGQVLCKITALETQTIDLSGDADPSGGTFIATVPGYGPTSALAYNVSAADFQIALRLIEGLEAVTVAKSGFVYTITFPAALGNVGQVTVNSASLTSGGTIAVTIATTHSGSATGKFGPYDPAATDGRQTLARGDCYLLNQTAFEVNPLTGVFSTSKDHPAVFDGGPVWKARLIATTGSHSLAAGPTFTELEAAFPRISYV